MATLTACAVDRTAEIPSITQHRRSIETAIAAAAAEAEATCGGPVELVVEGDPADYGYDPSDYQCRPR